MELNTFTFEELKTIAEELDGFAFDGRWGEEKLRNELESFIADNPIEEPPEPPEPSEPPEPPEPKEGEVAIKSIFRGVIGTSSGAIDFGEDGVATVPADVAEELVTLSGYELCN